jgi:hypothetical protein
MNESRFWDGEDDMYIIKAIEGAELIQFPNLKILPATQDSLAKRRGRRLQAGEWKYCRFPKPSPPLI